VGEPRVIFDIATKPYPTLLLWSCAGAAVFGCILLLLARIPWPHNARVKRIFGYFMLLSATITAGYYSFRWFSERRETRPEAG